MAKSYESSSVFLPMSKSEKIKQISVKFTELFQVYYVDKKILIYSTSKQNHL